MNKLEYKILKVFQELMIKDHSDPRYIMVDSELLCIIKGVEELDLYVKSEAPLDGRSVTMLKFSQINDNLYKVIWDPKFLYLIGNSETKTLKVESSSASKAYISKELELLSLSDNPLTNYLKTL